MHYFTMRINGGGLKECIQTAETLEEYTFKKLLETGLYKKYGYDERIKSTRYIMKNMQFNLGMPQYICKSEIPLYMIIGLVLHPECYIFSE